MSTALINPTMLSWARERLGFSVHDFAIKLGRKEEQLQMWEAAEKSMTFKQAMDFAKKAYIPFGYLFLPAPPSEELLLPDLRTVEGREVLKPSPELLEITKLMLQRQEWYKEYLQQQLGASNAIVGSFSEQTDVHAIVADMRNKLGVAFGAQRGNWEDYYRDLVGRIEALGILVMRQGDLGHHTRPLQVSEFRGFAIADPWAPLIFVNHADALGARLFTLIHELCHIWLGQSGISDVDTNNTRQEEVLCNAVAAEFLVPEKEFLEQWCIDLHTWQDNLPQLRSYFKVSGWVIARRALTFNLIDQNQYTQYIHAEKQAYKNQKDTSGGPSYYRTKKSQISQIFAKAVVSQALNGQVMLREASSLLGVKPNNILKLAKELQI